MRKALSVIGNVIIAIVVIFSILITALVIISTRDENNVPSLFGYAIMNIETDSMVGKDGLEPGTLIVVKRLTEEEIENDLRPGDVITFRRFLDGAPYMETHRIIPITQELVDGNPACSIYMSEVKDGVWYHGGHAYYVTRGDNTPAPDTNPAGNFDFASSFNLIGKWTGKQVPKLGAAMAFLRSPTGFMIFIVIPVALFFIYQLYVFIMTLTRRQKEQAIKEVADKEAELKAAAVAEFLAQQQANNGGTTPPATVDADTPDRVGADIIRPQETPSPQNDAPADKPADEPTPADISEAEKQRIIQEYLAKQKQSSDED